LDTEEPPVYSDGGGVQGAKPTPCGIRPIQKEIGLRDKDGFTIGSLWWLRVDRAAFGMALGGPPRMPAGIPPKHSLLVRHIVWHCSLPRDFCAWLLLWLSEERELRRNPSLRSWAR
jgi:hypothetical protein